MCRQIRPGPESMLKENRLIGWRVWLTSVNWLRLETLQHRFMTTVNHVELLKVHAVSMGKSIKLYVNERLLTIAHYFQTKTCHQIMFSLQILPFPHVDLQLLNGCFEFWMTFILRLCLANLFLVRQLLKDLTLKIIDWTYIIDFRIIYGSSLELHGLFVNTIICRFRAYSHQVKVGAKAKKIKGQVKKIRE